MANHKALSLDLQQKVQLLPKDCLEALRLFTTMIEGQLLPEDGKVFTQHLAQCKRGCHRTFRIINGHINLVIKGNES